MFYKTTMKPSVTMTCFLLILCMSQVFCTIQKADTKEKVKKPLTPEGKVKRYLKSCVERYNLVDNIIGIVYDIIMKSGASIPSRLTNLKPAVEFYVEANRQANQMVKHNGAGIHMRNVLTKLVCESDRNSLNERCEEFMHFCCQHLCEALLEFEKCTSLSKPSLTATIKKYTQTNPQNETI